jgi:hypothetical protein
LSLVFPYLSIVNDKTALIIASSLYLIEIWIFFHNVQYIEDYIRK